MERRGGKEESCTRKAAAAAVPPLVNLPAFLPASDRGARGRRCHSSDIAEKGKKSEEGDACIAKNA